MNKTKQSILAASVALVGAFGLTSCKKSDQSAGYEYMPDMYRSPAIEAYVDYGMDPFHFGDSLAIAMRNTKSARKPVPGTIVFSEDPAKVQFQMPYHLTDTDSGYAQSAFLRSPLVETEMVLAEGRDLYIINCLHCHGEKGQGDGKVITVGGHPPPGAYDGALKDLPEGKMFHAITYGKGVMGPHKALLSKEERWKVVAYIKTLQGNEPAETTTEEDSSSNDAESNS